MQYCSLCCKKIDPVDVVYLLYQGKVDEDDCFVQTSLPLNMLLCSKCMTDIKLLISTRE
jgi:hypothetical protein